jgi:hypothetical protein
MWQRIRGNAKREPEFSFRPDRVCLVYQAARSNVAATPTEKDTR